MDYEQLSAACRELHKKLDRLEAAQSIRMKLLVMRSKLLKACVNRLNCHRWN